MRFQNVSILGVSMLLVAWGLRGEAGARVAQDGPIGLDPDAALSVFGVPDEITATPTGGWAKWGWSVEQGAPLELVFAEDCVVLATPGVLAAYASGRRPALGEPMPGVGAYPGQSVADLAARLGTAKDYSLGAAGGVELEYATGTKVHVSSGRVIWVEAGM